MINIVNKEWNYLDLFYYRKLNISLLEQANEHNHYPHVINEQMFRYRRDFQTSIVARKYNSIINNKERLVSSNH